MCGRISRSSPRSVLADEFGIAEFVNVDLAPRYNIAPSQMVEAMVRDGAAVRLGPMRWGFANEPGAARAPINARAETVSRIAVFREAFAKRRCLIVADGFYEWQKAGSAKRPHFIRMRSGRPFGLAGIWTSFHAENGQRVPTCAILTCAANALMAPIHNRMPVILPPAARERWVDPSLDASPSLRALLAPFTSEEMEAYEVSTFVNSPRHDSPECVRRLA